MTLNELEELKRLGVPGTIKRYLPRLGKTPEEGGITKKHYDYLLALVASLRSGEASSMAEAPSSSDAHTRDSGTNREKITQSEHNNRQTHGYVADAIPVQLSEHPDQKAGKSQKTRLLALLQDRGWHDTKEIMAKIYKVGDDRGNCRIPSRICELRQEGHNIETKRITQTLTAYRLV